MAFVITVIISLYHKNKANVSKTAIWGNDWSDSQAWRVFKNHASFTESWRLQSYLCPCDLLERSRFVYWKLVYIGTIMVKYVALKMGVELSELKR